MPGAVKASYCRLWLKKSNFFYHVVMILVFSLFNSVFGAESVIKKYSKSLIAYYAFDGLDGNTLKDQSGRNHHGSVKNNDQFIVADGVFGNGGQFSNRNSVLIPSTKRLSKGDALTVMMWVRPQTVDGRVKFISKRSYDSQFNYFFMGMNDGGPFAGVGDGDLITATPKTFQIEADEWSHLCFVIDGNQSIRFYVNGEMKEVIDSDTTGFNTLNASMSLGSDFEGSEDFFSGVMDELIMIGEALSSEEIKEEFSRATIVQFSQVTDEMILANSKNYLSCYFPVDEGRGNFITDTINGLKGSLVGDLATEWSDEFLKSSVKLNNAGWIEVPHHSVLNFKKSLSVMVWIKPTQFGERKKIIYKGEKSSLLKFFTLGEDNGVLYAGVGNGESVALTGKKTKLLENEWQQVGLVFDLKKQTLELFHNGKLKETVGVGFPIFTGLTPLLLGNEPDQNGNGFNGYIADLKIYPVAVPEKLFKEDFESVRRRIESADRERIERKKIQEQLKKAYLELREIDRILGEDSQITESPGQEAATLSKVVQLIDQKKKRLKEMEQKERDRFAQLINRLNSKKESLNALLTDLNQEQYQKEFSVDSMSFSFDQVIKESGRLSHFEVELDLLIKQKQKEVELKRELARKKEERLQGQVEELISSINQIEKSLAMPLTQVETAKLNQNGDQYKAILQSTLNDLMARRDKEIENQKERIKSYRTQIEGLKAEINSLAEVIGKPKSRDVDLTSALVDDLDRLLSIKKFEEDVIAEFTRQLEEYRNASKKVFEQVRGDVLNALSEAVGNLQKLRELESKLNKSPGNYELPTKESLNQSQDIKVWLNGKSMVSETAAQIQKNINLLDSELRKKMIKQAEEEMIHLKDQWAALSSELALINDELGIKEVYRMPKPVSEKPAKGGMLPEYYFNFDEIQSKSIPEVLKGAIKMDLFNVLEDQWQQGVNNLGLRLDGIRSFGVINFNTEQNVSEMSLGISVNVLQFWGERSIVNFIDKSGNRSMEVRLFEKELQIVGNGVIAGIDFEKNLRKWKNITLLFEGQTGMVKLYVDTELQLSRNLNMSKVNFSKIQVGGSPLNEDVFYGLLDEFKWSYSVINASDISNWNSGNWQVSEDTDDVGLVDKIRQSISEMETKKKTRTFQLNKIREEQRIKLKEAHEKYLVTVKKLNEVLRELGLPEYPEIPPKPGTEVESLAKVEAELQKRSTQLQEKVEKDKAKSRVLKDQWREISDELADVYKALNVKQSLPVLPSDQALEEKISELKKVLDQAKLQLVQKRSSELKSTIEQNRLSFEQKIGAYREMLGKANDLLVKLQEVHGKLNESFESQNLAIPWNNVDREFAENYFNFDQATGPVVFSQSQQINYLVTNNADPVTIYDSGRFAKCLLLEDTSVHLKTESSQFGGTFSMLAWISIGQIKNDARILALESGDKSHALEIKYVEGQFVLESYKGNNRIRKWDLGRSAIKNSEWMHLAVLANKENEELSVYLNGVRMEQVSVDLLSQFNWSLILGGESRGNVGAKVVVVQLLVDELKIFNKVIDPKQIIKYGNVEEFDALDSRYQFLVDFLKRLESLYQEKTLKFREIEEKLKLENEKKNKVFMEGLNELNELHRKLGESEETEKDYELFDTEYRELVLKSRIRRAVARVEEIEAAKEAHEQEFTKISGEIEDLWEKITQFSNDLGQKISKPQYGRETAANVLREVKSLYLNKEKEWQAWKEKHAEEVRQAKIKSKDLIEKIEKMRQEMGTPLARGFELSDDVVVQTLQEVEKEFLKTAELYSEYQGQQSRKTLENIQLQRQKINSNLSQILTMSKEMGMEEKLSQTKKIYIVEGVNARLIHFFDHLENQFSFDQNYFHFFEAENCRIESEDFPYLKLLGQAAYSISSPVSLTKTAELEQESKVSIKYLLRLNDRPGQTQTITRLMVDSQTYFSVVKINKDVSVEIVQDSVKSVYPLKGILPVKSWLEMTIVWNRESKPNLRILAADKEVAFIPLKQGKVYDTLRIELGSSEATSSNATEFRSILVSQGEPYVSFKEIEEKSAYSDSALVSLGEYLATTTERLKKIESIWKEEKRLKEERRQKILGEIEKIKQEFKVYAPNEVLTVAIELGQEEKSLQELITKLSEAKLRHEEKLKEEEKLRQANQKRIRELSNRLSDIRKQAGLKQEIVRSDKMTDLEFISQLETQIAESESSLREREKIKREQDLALKLKKDKIIQEINEIKAKLKVSIADPLPDDLPKLEEIQAEWLLKLEKKQKQDELQVFERQLQKWKVSRDIYYEILNGIGETPEPLSDPVLQDIEKKLTEMEGKLNQARETSKLKVQNFKNKFEAMIGELKAITAELGQPITVPVFDANHAYKSVNDMTKLLDEQKQKLSDFKKKESERLKNIENSAEGIKQVIDKEKDEIRKYVRELQIKQYQFPTIRKQNPRIKYLSGYFKLDEFSGEYLRDEMDKMRKCFYKPFSESSKVIGKYGFALSFNGLDNFLSLELPEEILKANGMTVSCWVNTRRTFGKRVLVTFGRPERIFSLYIEDGYFFAEIKGGANEWKWATGIEVKRKEWQHLTLTVTNDEVVLLGDLMQTANQKMPHAFNNLVASPVVFGSEINQALNMFSGELDELKVFSPALPVEFIKGLSDEEDVVQEVSDVDILKEELELIRKERQSLLQKLKEKIEKEESQRIKLVEQINQFIADINQIQSKMNQPTLVYNYERGNETQAISELKTVLATKQQEFEEYKASHAMRTAEFQKEHAALVQEMDKLISKLGKERQEYIFEMSEGREEEILSQMKTGLKQLKEEFLLNQKQIEEKERLVLKEQVIEAVNALNSTLTDLKEPLFELSGEWEQNLSSSLEQVSKKLSEKQQQLMQRQENEARKEREKKEKEDRSKLMLQYKSVNRDLESLRRDLNLSVADSLSRERTDDPTALSYLNFEEGKGRLAKDLTENDNKALFMDYSIIWSKTGIYGGSIQFSGDEGIVKINSSQSLDAIRDFTMTLWLNPERLYGDRCVLHVGQGNVTRFSLLLRNENLFLRFEKGRLINTGMKINENTWQHLTVMYRSNQSVFQVFVEGILVSEIKDEHIQDNLFLGLPIFLGSDGQGDHFSGWIDEFKLFSRTLDESDLRENMKEGLPKIDASLDQYSLSQFEELVREMETELEKLRELKFVKDQQELARQEAKRKENIKLKEGRLKLLFNMQDQLKAGLKNKEISGSEEAKALSEFALTEDNADEFFKRIYGLRKELSSRHVGISAKKPQDLLGTFQLEAGDPQVFSRIQFEDVDGDKANDSGVSGQYAEGINFTKWKAQGISGNAVKLGDHGYLTISNQHKVSYNLKQSYQFWIYPSKEIKSKKMLLLQRGSLNIEIEQGMLRASVGGDWMNFKNLPLLQPDRWQLISISIDEFAGKILIGCGEDTMEEKDFKTKFGNPEGSIFIGGAPSESLRFYGLIDEVVIFHRLLVVSDFQHGYIYNESVTQGFCDDSLKTVWVEFDAEGVDFMRVYQEGYFTGAAWHPFKNKWILPVFKSTNKRTDSLSVICQLKNLYSNSVKELKLDIPIPYDPGIRFILPPENVEVTTK